MEERELKALEIAAKSKLTRRGKTWLVPSQSVRGAQYTVKLDPNEPECSCPDFEGRKLRCKHIFAVEYTIERDETPDGETFVTESFKVTRRTYPQDWKAYNVAQQSTTGQVSTMSIGQIIIFYPDGSTSNAEVRLQNARGELRAVRLRGLTGHVKVLTIKNVSSAEGDKP